MANLAYDSLEEFQAALVRRLYAQGTRSTDLEDQPAPWVLRGLQILEAGEELTAERIVRINRAGGTDHPHS